MPTTDVTHVIWDMDGTLLDTEQIYDNACKKVVGAFGRTMTVAVTKQIMGRPEKEGAAILIQELGLDTTPEKYVETCRGLRDSLWATTQLRPGVHDLVHHLHGARVRQAVATSSQQHEYRLKTRHHEGLFSCFETILKSEDVPTGRGKPHPDIFLAAAKQMGADPSRCLVVEDSLVGVRAAQAAGMRSLFVPHHSLLEGAPEDAQDISRMEMAVFAKQSIVAEANASISLPCLSLFKPHMVGLPAFCASSAAVTIK